MVTFTFGRISNSSKHDTRDFSATKYSSYGNDPTDVENPVSSLT